MTTNKNYRLIILIVVILLIAIPSISKTIKKHNDNLYLVVQKEIIDAAKKCYFEEQCKEDKIYLKDLYQLNYLEKKYDPISKEEINENSYVSITDNNYEFVLEE